MVLKLPKKLEGLVRVNWLDGAFKEKRRNN